MDMKTVKKIFFITLILFLNSSVYADQSNEYDIGGIKLNTNINDSSNVLKNDYKNLTSWLSEKKYQSGSFVSNNFLLGSYSSSIDNKTNNSEIFIISSNPIDNNIVAIEKTTNFVQNKPSVDNAIKLLKEKYGKPLLQKVETNEALKIFTFMLWSTNAKIINLSDDEKYKQTSCYKRFSKPLLDGDGNTYLSMIGKKINKDYGTFIACYVYTPKSDPAFVSKLQCNLMDLYGIKNSLDYVDDILQKGSLESKDKRKDIGDNLKIKL